MTPNTAPLGADLNDLFSTLHDIPDDIRATALQSSEIMQKNRVLEDSGLREARAEVQEREDRDRLVRRSNLVNKFYEPERKMALYKLKRMSVGDVLVVSMMDANNLRVACNYNQTYHNKRFYTAKFDYNKRSYIEIKRVE